MLPKKLHLEQIERFHDKIKEISRHMEECADHEHLKNRKLTLAMQYYDLSKLWIEIDNIVEMRIKHEIDCMEKTTQ